MKKLVFLLFISALGCKEISFPVPQPRDVKSLEEIPVALRGRYIGIRNDGTPEKDTVIVHSRGYRMSGASSDEADEGLISDSLVLKYYKGYYFLNLKENTVWLLRVIEPKKNGNLSFMSPEQIGDDFNTYVQKIGKEIEIDSTVIGDNKIYLIDPSPRELLKLIDKGFFQRTELKKVN